MAKPELGTKRLCSNCGAKFYDLNKDPIICPKCSTPFQVVVPTRGGRPDTARAVAPVAPVEQEETQDAELVSLEEADVEASGGKVAVAAEGDEDVEIDDDSLDDDATFLQETEDEDEDVADIIGGDIENEEET